MQIDLRRYWLCRTKPLHAAFCQFDCGNAICCALQYIAQPFGPPDEETIMNALSVSLAIKNDGRDPISPVEEAAEEVLRHFYKLYHLATKLSPRVKALLSRLLAWRR